MLHEDDPYWSIDRVSAAVTQSDSVIALTEHERDRLVESYGAREETTAVIPPGVEPGDGTPYSDRDQAVLFVGRRTASKRLDVLHAAMKIVWEEFPEMSSPVGRVTTRGGSGSGDLDGGRPEGARSSIHQARRRRTGYWAGRSVVVESLR